MKVERQENAVVLVPENDFERAALIELRKHSIKGMQFEDAWHQTGKLTIEFDTEWGR